MCLATITIGRHNTFVCLFQMYTTKRRQDCCLTWMLACWLAVLWPRYIIGTHTRWIRLKRSLNSYCNCDSCVDVRPMSMFSRCRHRKSETCRSITPISIVYSDRRRRIKQKDTQKRTNTLTHIYGAKPFLCMGIFFYFSLVSRKCFFTVLAFCAAITCKHRMQRRNICRTDLFEYQQFKIKLR